jgi:hypothetical protein
VTYRGPNLKGLVDDRVEQAIRQLYQKQAELQNHPALAPVAGPTTILNPVQAIDPATLDAAILARIPDIKDALEAGGAAPAQLDQLLGQAAQPQIPFAPKVMALPPLGDPQSQNGSLVRLGDVLYQFDTTVGEPGRWSAITGTAPIAGGTERVYSQNRVQVNFSGGAGVFGVLQQNPGILTADVNALGKVIRYYGEGVYNTVAGQTPQFFFALYFDFVSGTPQQLAVFGPTIAAPASTLNGFWFINAILAVTTNPLPGPACTLEISGTLGMALTVGNTVLSWVGIVQAVFVNLTVPHSLDLVAQMSTQAGGAPFNGVTQRYSLVELLN